MKAAQVPSTEVGKERAAFDQTWQALEPNLEAARNVRKRALENPEVLNDPGNRALVRWLDAFERQLIALENFRKVTAEGSLELPVEDVRFVRENADELLGALQQARTLLAESAAS